MRKKEDIIRIIGIDPGTHICGYGLIDVKAIDSILYLDHGMLKVPNKDSVAQRLCKIGDQLEELLSKFQPQVAVLEKAFVGRNAHTGIVLGQARGMLLYLLAKHKLEIQEVATRQVKKGISGSGLASKKHIRHLILHTLHLKDSYKNHLLTLDATDALAMAFYHGRSYTVRNKMNKESRA